eukprot:m.374455 g.374455  ORF g.374455 m.374455 type:complete len:406 (+) comp20907_c0_seq7:307-1524(+)
MLSNRILIVSCSLLLAALSVVTANVTHNGHNRDYIARAHGAPALRCPDSVNGTFCKSDKNFCCPGGYHCKSQSPMCLVCVPDDTKNPFLFDTEAYRACNASEATTVQTLTIKVQLPRDENAPQTRNGTSKTLYFPYYSTGNTPVAKIDAKQNVIIVQHGAARNAADYLCAMEGASTYDGMPSPSSYVLIAPHFLDSSDHPPPPSNSTSWLYWNRTDGNGLWRSGENDALNQVSSYAVMDALLKQIPSSSSRNITLAGHSSGGQFIQRYALAGKEVETLQNVEYVVANPSSYVYFDELRWNGSGFAPVSSSAVTKCPMYNAWEWGFDDVSARPPYLRNLNLSFEAEVCVPDFWAVANDATQCHSIELAHDSSYMCTKFLPMWKFDTFTFVEKAFHVSIRSVQFNCR